MERDNILWRIGVIEGKLTWVSPPRERSDLVAQLRCQRELLKQEGEEEEKINE